MLVKSNVFNHVHNNNSMILYQTININVLIHVQKEKTICKYYIKEKLVQTNFNVLPLMLVIKKVNMFTLKIRDVKMLA